MGTCNQQLSYPSPSQQEFLLDADQTGLQFHQNTAWLQVYEGQFSSFAQYYHNYLRSYRDRSPQVINFFYRQFKRVFSLNFFTFHSCHHLLVAGSNQFLDLNTVLFPNFSFNVSSYGHISAHRKQSIHIEVLIFPAFCSYTSVTCNEHTLLHTPHFVHFSRLCQDEVKAPTLSL